ncbi:MAG: TetR/AcrR family transcriptional regulator [Actinomycetota bacterium]|nr:TetR/AcrR family transcriptional regulator [Actinomycetota bacterium]
MPSTAPVPAKPLPRGPHGLSRDQVAESQRARLLTAFTSLLAQGGYSAVTIGALAERAGVSRGAFYSLFADKQDCLLAAYADFAANLLSAMTAEVAEDADWETFVARTLGAYLGGLESDRVAARAFIVEMDTAGKLARDRRREASHGFASMIAERHAVMRARNPELGGLPKSAFRGLVFGVRELVREELEREGERPLTDLMPEIQVWATAMIAGAPRDA